MKKLSVIILASILSFATISCSDNDDENQQETLIGGTWKLISFNIDGIDFTNTLDKCGLLETYSFTEDGKFVNKDFKLDESTDKCNSESDFGTWVGSGDINGSDGFTIVFDTDKEKEEPVTFVLGRLNLIYNDDVEQRDGTIKTYGYSFEKQ